MRISDWSSDVCSSDLRQRRHLGGRQIVQASDRHRNIGAADLLDIAMAERRHAARLAEDMMCAVRSELIVGQRGGVAEQAKRHGLRLPVPTSLFRAERTIELAPSRRKVHVGFCLDGAAVALHMPHGTASPGDRLFKECIPPWLPN